MFGTAEKVFEMQKFKQPHLDNIMTQFNDVCSLLGGTSSTYVSINLHTFAT